MCAADAHFAADPCSAVAAPTHPRPSQEASPSQHSHLRSLHSLVAATSQAEERACQVGASEEQRKLHCEAAAAAK